MSRYGCGVDVYFTARFSIPAYSKPGGMRINNCDSYASSCLFATFTAIFNRRPVPRINDGPSTLKINQIETIKIDIKMQLHQTYMLAVKDKSGTHARCPHRLRILTSPLMDGGTCTSSTGLSCRDESSPSE